METTGSLAWITTLESVFLGDFADPKFIEPYLLPIKLHKNMAKP